MTARQDAYVEKTDVWAKLALPVPTGAISWRQVPLNRGYVALVDETDYGRISRHHWTARVEPSGTVYAVRSVKVDRQNRVIRMHREILDATGSADVDHRNGDGLDNRRANLRSATRSQNMGNVGKRRGAGGRATSSRFKGVTFCKQTGRWRAMIKLDYKTRNIGRFDTEVEAAHAYDLAARQYFGEFARLNFSEAA